MDLNTQTKLLAGSKMVELDRNYCWFQYPLVDKSTMEFDSNFLNIFNRIKSLPRLFDLLCNSIFVDICGNKKLKQALVLALFGATAKLDKECPNIVIRNHINVLIMGNRSSEKNSFLKCLTSVMNHCCYIVGNSSSVRLIAANLSKKGNVVGEGALVSQQRGVSCIDELEKMDNSQQQIVIQSIEHQKIGVKGEANGFWYFPSNITFVAAANLNTKDYDYSKSIEQNVRISLDLLSKFDLIFLIDENSNYDEMVFEKEIKKLNNSSDTSSVIDGDALKDLIDYQDEFGESVFQDNFLLSPSILCQYINYCYEYFHPVVNEEIQTMLQTYCLNEICSSVVLSKLRIYETLIRLAEAHSKIFMRQEVTEEDAQVAINIIEDSLTLVKLQAPVKKIKRGSFRPAVLYKIICEATNFYQKKQFTSEEIVQICQQYCDRNLDTNQVLNSIYCLNEEALLIKKDNYYEIV